MQLLQLIKKLSINNEFKLILIIFICWKLYLVLILTLAVLLIPLAGTNFLGGGMQNYLDKPWLFAWANFDGEHYLSIAQIGYKGLEQAFFPVYPLLIRFFATPFGLNITSLTVTGILISHVAFITSLLLLFKLLVLDYPAKIALLTLGLILVFPTSFYLVSLYNEALFLSLSLASFLLARSEKWFWASLLGAISSATRIFGLILLPALLIEAWQQKMPLKKYFWIFFIPLGLLAYMYYQWIAVGDPLAFYHLQKIVGPQHESGITLMPQVYIRYIKMFLTTDISNPIFQTLVLEFFTGILFLFLPIYGYFKKVRLSYLFYGLVGFLLPTIQGSLSSVPRYVIILFPGFLVLALILNKLPKLLKGLLLILSLIWMSLELMLYLRGYWIA